MNKQKLKYILPFGIILISIILAVIIFMAKADIKPEAQEIKALQVQVMSAVRKEVQLTVKSQGTVRAKTES